MLCRREWHDENEEIVVAEMWEIKIRGKDDKDKLDGVYVLRVSKIETRTIVLRCSVSILVG